MANSYSFCYNFSFIILGLYKIDASGEMWDENYRNISGRKYISNFLHLDFSKASWGWQYEHPPIGRYPYPRLLEKI